jgi:hypothetical protein
MAALRRRLAPLAGGLERLQKLLAPAPGVALGFLRG